MVIRYVMQTGVYTIKSRALELWRERRHGMAILKSHDEEPGGADEESGALLVDDEGSLDAIDAGRRRDEKLNLRETAWLSLEFCMLWFLANYFASACLEYTSVGSATILTSTSSIWTLIFCAVWGVEGFTIRKLLGVVASLAGVILISTIDLSGMSDGDRGSFPHKTTGEIAIGDAMAFLSAIIYGMYVTVMKRRVGNEDRVNMPLFFGLVGLFNVVLLWPGFFILHFTGIETVSHRPQNLGRLLTFPVRITANRQDLDHHHGQLDCILLERHVMGIRHAPHDAARRDSRHLADNTTLADWRDDSILAVFQLGILGRGRHCASFVCVCQPRIS